jgi:hypothetical protein
MELLIVIVAVAVISWKASQLWHLMAFKKMLEDLNIGNAQLLKVAEDNGIDVSELDPNNELPELEVRIEQHPEGLFAYRKADDSFIAQGADREKLMENLVNNLTNVRVIVAKEDGADLISS